MHASSFIVPLPPLDGSATSAVSNEIIGPDISHASHSARLQVSPSILRVSPFFVRMQVSFATLPCCRCLAPAASALGFSYLWASKLNKGNHH